MDGPPPLAVALLFGGPSAERNISCGSLKPWATYLARSPRVRLSVLFFDPERRAHLLPPRYVYTNTCEDFESQLSPADALEGDELARLLRRQELVVPLIHGELGEDGEVQGRLDELGVPYLFARPEALAASLDKARCHDRLAAAGLATPRHLALPAAEVARDPAGALERVRERLGPTADEGLAVKPRCGGSSLGVSLIAAEAGELARAAAAAGVHGPDVLVEELLRGPEFSVIVLEDDDGRPVALAPTEVVPRGAFFDERAKYLQGEAATYHTPFPGDERAAAIRRAAEAAWEALGMRHMARVDGFLTQEGVHVTDVNGVSGFGFSSFVFQQSAMIGLSHAELIERLVLRGLPAARAEELGPFLAGGVAPRADRLRVHVLLGGTTSERQVSRQSGAFVGLCLLAAGHDVRFHLMDLESRFTEVGLFLALHHDVDEIQGLVRDRERREGIARAARAIGARLGLDAARAVSHLGVGRTTDLPRAVAGADFCFVGLHGGAGEDGTVQTALERLGVPYNGPGPSASELCADKHACARAVAEAAGLPPRLRAPRQRRVGRAELRTWARDDTDEAWERRLEELSAEVGSAALVLKPAADGCSTGVKLVRTAGELRGYVDAVLAMRAELAPGELGPGSRILRLPEPPPRDWLVEEAFVDEPPVPLPPPPWNAASLSGWFARRRWVELTCAVLERGPGEGFTVAVPSITVAAAAELSREEKFQQGVGTNLELSLFLDDERLAAVRARFGALAETLGIEGYARLDAFYDRGADELVLLEANTLCGLTEATVFYTQMLATAELSPPEVLDEIVRLGSARRS